MTDLLIQNGTVITMESGCEVLSGTATSSGWASARERR